MVDNGFDVDDYEFLDPYLKQMSSDMKKLRDEIGVDIKSLRDDMVVDIKSLRDEIGDNIKRLKEKNDTDQMRVTIPQAWNEHGVREEQMKVEDIAPIFEWIERGVKPQWQQLAKHGEITKSYWAQWDCLAIQRGVLYRKCSVSHNRRWGKFPFTINSSKNTC